MAKRCQLFRFQASWLTTRSYNILFFGSDEFSIASLSAIHRQKYASGEPLFKHLQVVTPPVSRWEIDKCSYLVITAKLYNFAKNELDLVVHQAPPRTLNGWALPKTPDVVVSFGYFIPKTMLDGLRHGALNVHPSLLPRHRGSSPIQYTILNGDKECGVSIIELSSKAFDAGRILSQTKKNIFFGHLYDDLAVDGANDVVHVIKNLDACRKYSIEQDSHLVTFAPKLLKAAAHIKWKSSTVQDIYRKYRAFGEKFKNKRLQLLKFENPAILELPESLNSDIYEPGSLFYEKGPQIILVKCMDSWIAVSRLRMQDRNDVSSADFDNGYQLKSLDRFLDEEDTFKA